MQSNYYLALTKLSSNYLFLNTLAKVFCIPQVGSPAWLSQHTYMRKLLDIISLCFIVYI